MRKFTDTELDLAPEVAEVMGPGRDYQKGDLVFNDGKVELHGGPFPCRPLFKVGHHWLPLEYDCLEWLRERYDVLHIHYSSELGERIWDIDTYSAYSESPTLLETLYRVIVSGGER